MCLDAHIVRLLMVALYTVLVVYTILTTSFMIT